MLCVHHTPVNRLSNSTFTFAYFNKILCEAEFYWHRHQTRKRLKGLSERQLQDIGINRQQALQEANKPFWQ